MVEVMRDNFTETLNKKNKMKTKKYQEDLQLLLKLGINTNAKNEFRKKMSDEHKVSLKTIYRDEKKMSEGKFILARKVRTDRGKLKVKPTARAVKLMRELKESGKKLKEAIPIITSITGERISARTKTKISNKLRKTKDENTGNNSTEVSEFGGEIKKFLEEHFNLDKIAPTKSVKVRLGKYSFCISKNEIRDIILILSNAYNNSNNGEDKLKVDRIELLKMKIYHLLEDHIRVAEANMDTKQLESITRQYNMLKDKDREITANIKVFENCMKEIKPNISFEEIYDLIKKHSQEEE